MPCPYKDLFGAPGTGAHSYRIADVAVVDTGLTALLAYAIARYYEKPFWTVFLILFLIGEVMHYHFCVQTTFIKWIKGAGLI